MPTTDKRIDAYIGRSAAFARPILRHLRSLVHRGCPDVVETIKWGMPSFEHRGILCGMASFKAHCTFGFWKHTLLNDAAGALSSSSDAMGSLGRITAASDLPADSTLLRLIRQAAKLNEQGVALARNRRKALPPQKVPADMAKAIRGNAKAASAFRGFSPSHQKEYIEWVTEAKLPETREKRIATAVEWLALGRSRNWKYERNSPKKKGARKS